MKNLPVLLLTIAAACAGASNGLNRPEPVPEVTEPSVSGPVVGGPVDAGPEPMRRASACLADPGCPATEAERLLLAAADAHDAEVDCFRLLDGGITPRDPVRGRACLERTMGPACEGPADLARVELALMSIDGLGGKVDIAAARALVTSCQDDVARAEVLKHADAKERDPNSPPLDICKESTGSKGTSALCRVRLRDTASERLELAAKLVFAPLDDVGKTLFLAAHRAHADYVTAMTFFASTCYGGNAGRSAVGLIMQQRLFDARTQDLAANAAELPTVSSDEVNRAQRSQEAAIAKLRLVVPAEKTSFRKADEKWTAYRRAELALQEHALGPKYGAPQVRAAISVRLAERRAKDAVRP